MKSFNFIEEKQIYGNNDDNNTTIFFNPRHKHIHLFECFD